MEDEELSYTPLLASLKGKNTIEEAPAGYFEALPGAMRSRVGNEADDEAVMATLPLLKAAPKTLPAAPDGYFDAFPARIAHAIAPVAPVAPVAPAEGRMRPLRPAWLPVSAKRTYAIAATVAVLLVAGIALLRLQPAEAPVYQAQSTQEALKAFTEEELLAVAVEHTTSSSQLEDAVREDELARIALPQNHLPALTRQDADEILEELDVEDIDPALLDDIDLQTLDI